MNWKISHSLKWDKYEVKERELRNSALNVAPAWGDSVRNTTEQLMDQGIFPDTSEGTGDGQALFVKNGVMLLVLKSGMHLPCEFGSVISEVRHFWMHV